MSDDGLLLLQRFPHALRDQRRIFVEREGHGSFQPVRPGDEHLHAAPERISRDECLMRPGDVLPASDDR